MEAKNSAYLSDRLLFWSLCLMFFLIPIRTAPHVIAGSFALAVWIFSGKIIKDRDSWIHEPWSKPVLCLILLPWLGLLWTDDMESGIRLAKKSHYWIYSFAIASIPGKDDKGRWLIFALILGLIISVFIAMGQLLGWIPITKDYATGLMGGKPTHIVYSLLLVFALLVFSFYFSSCTKRLHRIVCLCLMILFTVNLVMVPGRAGYLTFILLSPLLIFNLVGKQNVWRIALLVILFCSILLSSSLVRARIFQAHHEIQQYLKEGSAETSIGGRFLMWDGAIRMFFANPMIGVGTGDYRNKITEHTGKMTIFTHPHNNFLYMAACFGIVGVMVMAWYFIVILRRGWQTRGTLTGFLLLSFGLIIFIGGMTDTQIMNQFTGVTLALLTGMGVRQQEKSPG